MRPAKLGLALMVALAVLTACDDRAAPPTLVTVELLDYGDRVRYQGEEIGITDLHRALQTEADRRRSAVTGSSAGMRIVIVTPNGANDRHARELADYCYGIGLGAVSFQTVP